jgi:hypothetical protein
VKLPVFFVDYSDKIRAMPDNKDQFLLAETGRTSQFWIGLIQNLIQEFSEVVDDPKHPETDVEAWISTLTKKLVDVLPEDKNYDENIRVARELGLLLVLWSVRISRAKAYDPNRPAELRLRALAGLRNYVAALQDAIHDETMDDLYFNGQDWNPPYGPSVREGDFV